jgi:hypothetical protein
VHTGSVLRLSVGASRRGVQQGVQVAQRGRRGGATPGGTFQQHKQHQPQSGETHLDAFIVAAAAAAAAPAAASFFRA